MLTDKALQVAGTGRGGGDGTRVPEMMPETVDSVSGTACFIASLPGLHFSKTLPRGAEITTRNPPQCTCFWTALSHAVHRRSHVRRSEDVRLFGERVPLCNGQQTLMKEPVPGDQAVSPRALMYLYRLYFV